MRYIVGTAESAVLLLIVVAADISVLVANQGPRLLYITGLYIRVALVYIIVWPIC